MTRTKASNYSGIVSVRLSPAERQLVEDAAAKKGWKVATFLRESSLERAVHILNLSRATSFDFSGVAKRLAEAIVAPRSVEIINEMNGVPIGRFGEGPIQHLPNTIQLEESTLTNFHPKPFTQDEVQGMSEAVRLGGLDFAAQLISDCRRLVSASNDQNLPAPIDPDFIPGASGGIEEQEQEDE